MSVLIKGFDEIPDDGEVLTVKHYDNGKAYIKLAFMTGYSSELIKLPETHGRLIDADALMNVFADRLTKVSVRYGIDSAVAGAVAGAISGAMKLLDVQPTVIEAEGKS